MTAAVDPLRVWLAELTQASEPWLRVGAVRALGVTGGLAEHADRLLGDQDPLVRIAVVLGLGEGSTTAARWRLDRLLASPPGEVDLRPFAAVALAIGAGESGAGGAFGLRSALERGGPVDLRAALWLAVAHGGLPIAPPLLEAELAEPGVSVATAPALSCSRFADDAELDRWRHLGARGQAVHLALLTRVAASPLPGARAFLHSALRNRGGPLAEEVWYAGQSHPEALAWLLEAVTTGQKYLRGTAALALAGHALQHDAKIARTAILDALRDNRSAAQRPALLLAAGLVSHPLAGVAAREQLEHGSQGLEALAAIDALGLVGDPNAVTTLWWVLQNRTEADVLARAFDVLARIDGDAFARAMLDGSLRPSAAAPAALVALGRTRVPGAIARLRAIVGDSRRALSERQAALAGIAHGLRRSRGSPWDRYAQGVAFTWLPPWLLQHIRNCQ
ncbi:MAG: hypothetical protein IPK26_29740 [Planctomycetes bacterium]|nr:hypothetical protein [Planctomycetota bacterium]